MTTVATNEFSIRFAGEMLRGQQKQVYISEERAQGEKY